MNLSVNRTRACSTCHNPDRAFVTSSKRRGLSVIDSS
ncbi:MAG: hypothetical protein P8163_11210 [Candidatus Thiodiazotropha sp.]